MNPRAEPDALGFLVQTLRARFDSRDADHPSVVLVVGAGASVESGMPTWKDPELRDRLVTELGAAVGTPAKFVEEACFQLARVLPAETASADVEEKRRLLIENASTEQLCAVGSRWVSGRNRLMEVLASAYKPDGDDPQPQLACELIAHLVKHRFVDHVVSLNFDEVLDLALGDELGAAGFRLVLPGVTGARGADDRPHLFKLHGTISDHDSLRFDLSDTGMLSPRLLRLLDRIVFGVVPRSESEDDTPSGDRRLRNVFIVSLGYSWKDPDMQTWVVRHAAAVPAIFCIDLDGAAAAALRAVFGVRGVASRASGIKVLEIATEKVVSDGVAATIDEVLWAVWRALHASEEPMSRRVPSAARHLLVSHLFPSRTPKRQWPSAFGTHDRHSRFIAEVFLTAGKTKGMVTLSSVARDSRIRRHLPERDTDGLPERDTGGLPLLEQLKFLSRNDEAEVTEVYFYDGELEHYTRHFETNVGKPLIENGEPLRDLAGQLITEPRIEGERIRRHTRPYLEFLARYLRSTFEGPSIEVDPEFDDRTTLLLPGSKPLRTYKSLKDRTNALLRDTAWQTLLTIAESGTWLDAFADVIDGSAGRTVLLIEASAFGLTKWQARSFATRRNVPAATIGLPWWLHNRHLTVALGRDHELLGGIYFRRRERTPRISPIDVRSESLRELIRMFLAYVARFYEEYPTWYVADSMERYDPDGFFEDLMRLDIRALLGSDDAHWENRLRKARLTYQNSRSRLA
jgi:hypothetical protein